MSLWRQASRGLRALLHPESASREIDDEIRHFVDAANDDVMAEGASPDGARRTTRLRFGSTLAVREAVRSHGWEHHVATLVADLRYAARGLCRRPGFSLVAILTLALGIGASTAIFSAAYPVLFAALPYPHGDRVVMISDRADNGDPIDLTYGSFLEIAQRSRSFSALAAADRWQPALMQAGEPERLTGERVTPDYFRVIGIAPMIGRNFDAADDLTGAAPVVIVSNGLAVRQLGGAQAARGRSIILDGKSFTVIGVMPPGFTNALSPSASVWAPRRYQANTSFESAEWGHHMQAIARLAPGVSVSQAVREMAAIARTPLPVFSRPPWAAMAGGLGVESLQRGATRGARPALLAMVAAVLLVLAIAAVNVANLLLARGAQRRAELAMRATLGASRGRLLRQLFTESVLLAGIGGGFGILLAAVGVRALGGLVPVGLSRVAAIHLDPVTLLFSIVLTASVGIAVGVAPAWYGSRRALHADIREGPRVAGVAHPGLRRVLVTAEIALALVVLVGAGLMLRSMTRLLAQPVGFDPSAMITMQVEAAGHQYDSTVAAYQYFNQVVNAVRQVPGVTAAAFTSQLPLSGDDEGYSVELESQPSAGTNAISGFSSALRYTVTPGWFHAMEIPLRQGRLLDATDRPGNVAAVVVSESFAQAHFAGRNPVGQRVRAGPDAGHSDRPWAVIVGVVGNVKQASLAAGPESAFYEAMGQWTWIDRTQSLVVRTRVDPATRIVAVKRAVWSVDRNQPISGVTTMANIVNRSEAQRHFVLAMFAAFGLSALALSAIGMFGVISGGVTERIRELGVRAALGASRGSIVSLVLGQGMILALAGVAIGVAGAAAMSGMLRTLLFGISRNDAASYVMAAGLVLLVALLASAIPAWRAARIDPAITLRG